MRERTALYRFYDADGELLYIGITTDPDVRWACHESTSWWKEVDRMQTKVAWYDERAEAGSAEVAAIKAERPRHNRAHADYQPSQGTAIKELRRYLADILNAAAAHGTITYVTSRGRRIAAVVPLAVVEAARKADSD